MDGFLDHWRDMNLSPTQPLNSWKASIWYKTASPAKFMRARSSSIFSSPLACFSNYPRETRLDYIKRFYDAVSTFKISLPTPIMSGVRTLNPSVQLLRADRVRRQPGFHQRHLQRDCEIRFPSAPASASTPGAFARWAARSAAAKPSTPAAFRSAQAFPDRGEILLAGRRARRRGNPLLPNVASGSGKPAGAEKQPWYRRQPRSSHGLRGTDQQADVHPSAEGQRYYPVQPFRRPGPV